MLCVLVFIHFLLSCFFSFGYKEADMKLVRRETRTAGRFEGNERGSSTWSAEIVMGRESRAVRKALAKVSSVIAPVVLERMDG